MPVVASAAMNEAVVERPAWRISFRLLMGIALGLALVALIAGRHIYKRYGGYQPLALAHVPQTARYRARVDLSDTPRVAAVAPLLNALDPRHTRVPALERKLGVSLKQAAHEVAFGVGPDPFDFVLVLGLQLQAGTGLPAATALCEVLSSDGIRSEPTQGSDGAVSGCRMADGAIVAGTPEGALVVASRAELVKGLLGRPDLGDRLGFSGPSVRGVAPEVKELGRETSTLVQRLSAKYP
jgi:hypothetical protein